MERWAPPQVSASKTAKRCTNSATAVPTDLHRSLRIFSLLVTYDHLELRYLMALAASAQMLGRYADAIQHYGISAAVLMLDDPAPLLHSAECCIAIQQMEGAAEALRMAIGLIDRVPSILRPRAQALLVCWPPPGIEKTDRGETQ